ncbi:dph4 [Dermatophagoides farinae]|uniref:Dph4 n=1 Tax=Dermatophagoides farinae TaxID=6954 RepID=A0A9D4SIF8_DERFA|nr:DPH4 homolog [Dermatophagoides farinae]XP_046917463.1 DPH4 homolog [Dermatophagoides farinae]KAH7643132.1 dph4 [Dermatophagoides farinae]
MSNSNNDDKNLYAILGCTEDATIDDIRRNYKKLALKCHPDKQQQQQQQQNLPNDDDDGGQMMIKPEFSQLNQAATILSDSREKFKYDSSLLAQKSPQSIINDEINLNDFYKDDNGHRIYDCRCGGHFRIDHNDSNRSSSSLSQSMIIIDCDSCSLSIRLIDG